MLEIIGICAICYVCLIYMIGTILRDFTKTDDDLLDDLRKR